MDSYRGAATLEWRVNGATCVGSFGVGISVGVVGRDWTCRATLETEGWSEGRHEGFDLLMELDPVFTLCLDEGGEIVVDVRRTGRGDHLTLTVHEPAPLGASATAPETRIAR